MNISQQPEYNLLHATSSSINSSNGVQYTNNRPLPTPFLCHESAINQQSYPHLMNGASSSGSCCPQQMKNVKPEHIYSEYEPYGHQHRKYNSR